MCFVFENIVSYKFLIKLYFDICCSPIKVDERERCLLSLFLSLDNSEASSGPGWDLLPQTPVPLVYYYMLNAQGLWAFKSDDDESASERGNT